MKGKVIKMEERNFYCNCCGTEWKSTEEDENVSCPNCGCEYNPDENDYIECYD